MPPKFRLPRTVTEDDHTKAKQYHRWGIEGKNEFFHWFEAPANFILNSRLIFTVYKGSGKKFMYHLLSAESTIQIWCVFCVFTQKKNANTVVVITASACVCTYIMSLTFWDPFVLHSMLTYATQMSNSEYVYSLNSMRTSIPAYSKLVLIFALGLNVNWLSQTFSNTHANASIALHLLVTAANAGATLCKYRLEYTLLGQMCDAFKYKWNAEHHERIHAHPSAHHSKVFGSFLLRYLY